VGTNGLKDLHHPGAVMSLQILAVKVTK